MAPRASRSSTGTAPGANYPAFADIKKLVIDAGKSQTPTDEIRQVLYNHGVYNSMLIAEAIAEAQKITGKKVVTGEDVRRGLENLNIDDARLKAIGLGRLRRRRSRRAAPTTTAIRATFVQQWDGAKWVKVERRDRAGFGEGQPLLDEAAKAYAEKNAGWPARTEPCDNKLTRLALIRPGQRAFDRRPSFDGLWRR